MPLQDIEDLKNKKIKEVEDLLDIKSRKEQSMKDLESLKSEIIKHKALIESVRKIRLKEAQRSSAQKERELHNPSPSKTVSPIPVHRSSQSPLITNKHLPDLVNHEKILQKKKTPELQSNNENLRYANLSKEYLHHLKQAQNCPEQGKVSAGKSVPPLDNIATGIHHSQPVNQLGNPVADQLKRAPVAGPGMHDVRHHQLTGSLHKSNPREEINIKESARSSGDFGDPREFNQTNIERSFQMKNQSVSLTKVASKTIMPGVSGHNEGERANNKADQGPFIRPREFSRESHLPSPSEANSYFTNLNNQKQTAQFLQTMQSSPDWSQFVQQNLSRQSNFQREENALSSKTAQHHTKSSNFAAPIQSRESTILSKCTMCNRVANFLCSGCQGVYYCTVQCQVGFARNFFCF